MLFAFFASWCDHSDLSLHILKGELKTTGLWDLIMCNLIKLTTLRMFPPAPMWTRKLFIEEGTNSALLYVKLPFLLRLFAPFRLASSASAQTVWAVSQLILNTNSLPVLWVLEAKTTDRFVLKQTGRVMPLGRGRRCVCLFVCLSFWQWTKDTFNGLNMSPHISVCPDPSERSLFSVSAHLPPSCSQHGAFLWNSRFPVTLLGNPLRLCRRWDINWSVIDFSWMTWFNFQTVSSISYGCSDKDNTSRGKTHICITMEICKVKLWLCVYITRLLGHIMIYYLFYWTKVSVCIRVHTYKSAYMRIKLIAQTAQVLCFYIYQLCQCTRVCVCQCVWVFTCVHSFVWGS